MTRPGAGAAFLGRLLRVVATFLVLLPGVARAVEEIPRELKDVGVTEKLGTVVDGDLRFTDPTGKSVRLGDYLDDGEPVILTLNYYACKTLCSVQLNGLAKGLKDFDWAPGDGYRVVTISIDPREKAPLAAEKRASFLDGLGKGEVDWSFLVGDEASVKALASQIGFSYHYDEDTDQFAHPAVLAVLAPGGKLARYLYGIEYSAKDLKFAVMEAAEGRLGSPVEKLVLSCFRFDQSSGRYTPAAVGIMRLGGIVTMLGLGVFGLVMWRRDGGRPARRAR